MPSLQIRELPDNIYYLLQQKANAEHRTLTQEAIVMLAKGLNTSVSHKNRRQELLDTIITNNQSDKKTLEQLDPVEMIREDRQR